MKNGEVMNRDHILFEYPSSFADVPRFMILINLAFLIGGILLCISFLITYFYYDSPDGFVLVLGILVLLVFCIDGQYQQRIIITNEYITLIDNKKFENLYKILFPIIVPLRMFWTKIELFAIREIVIWENKKGLEIIMEDNNSFVLDDEKLFFDNFHRINHVLNSLSIKHDFIYLSKYKNRKKR